MSLSEEDELMRNIPVYAKVTTYAASELSTAMMPAVGVRYPDAEEQALINEIATAVGGGF